MTKERLLRYRDLQRERRQIQERMKELQLEWEAPRIQHTTPVLARSSEAGRAMEQAVAQREQLETRYCQQCATIAAECNAIEAALSSLPVRERIVMRMRYIKGMRWEDICTAAHYSWRQVHRIHGAALARLTEK